MPGSLHGRELAATSEVSGLSFWQGPAAASAAWMLRWGGRETALATTLINTCSAAKKHWSFSFLDAKNWFQLHGISYKEAIGVSKSFSTLSLPSLKLPVLEYSLVLGHRLLHLHTWFIWCLNNIHIYVFNCLASLSVVEIDLSDYNVQLVFNWV